MDHRWLNQEVQPAFGRLTVKSSGGNERIVEVEKPHFRATFPSGSFLRHAWSKHQDYTGDLEHLIQEAVADTMAALLKPEL